MSTDVFEATETLEQRVERLEEENQRLTKKLALRQPRASHIEWTPEIMMRAGVVVYSLSPDMPPGHVPCPEFDELLGEVTDSADNLEEVQALRRLRERYAKTQEDIERARGTLESLKKCERQLIVEGKSTADVEKQIVETQTILDRTSRVLVVVRAELSRAKAQANQAVAETLQQAFLRAKRHADAEATQIKSELAELWPIFVAFADAARLAEKIFLTLDERMRRHLTAFGTPIKSPEQLVNGIKRSIGLDVVDGGVR